MHKKGTLDKMREFFRKLPKNKFISLKQVEDKFNIRNSTAYVNMRVIAREQKLKSDLIQTQINNRAYYVRVFYK